MHAYSFDEITKTITARLEQDTRVNLHRSPITIRIEDNAIILQGQVNNMAEKRAAMDTSIRTLLQLGHWSVIDRLHVKPGAHKQDLELKQAVAAMLSEEPVFRDYTLLARVAEQFETLRDMGPGNKVILFHVTDGCISLAGQVESLSHYRLAEVLMWWTEGCEFVDNQLDVVPPQVDSDNEITDTVRMVLEKDPLVHADQLFIGTAGGVVMLTGSVASEQERQLATMDAWYVPGVADVVAHIEARG